MSIHGPYSPQILIQKSEERVKNLHFYQEVCILTQVFQESQYNNHRETTSLLCLLWKTHCWAMYAVSCQLLGPKVSPSASAVRQEKAYFEEQDGAGESRPKGWGRTPFLGPGPVAQRGVAAADAHGVQSPRGAERLVPGRGDEAGRRRRARLAVQDPCNTEPKERR